MEIQKLKCNDRRPPRTPDGILFTIAALLSLLAVAFSAAGQSISWEPVQAPRTGIAVTPAASATTTIERAAARDQHFYAKTGRLPDTFEAPFMPIPARTLEGQRVEQKSAAPLDERPTLPPSPAPPAFTEGFLATTSGARPPDTNGAVGPDHLMVILNSGITIQDKQGNKLSSVTLSSFWGEFPGLSNVFDPKVIYDPLADRFLAVAVANRRTSDSAILLAVSATSDPMDPWGQWLFDADPGGTTWLDFPYIGMTQDKITFTANLFINTDDTFLGSTIWVVDKSTALDGGSITTTSFSNSGEAAPAAALTYDAGETTQFMLTQINSSFGGMGVLQLSMISGSATSPTFSLSSNFILGKQWNSTFPDAPQEGSIDEIETNDDRTQNAVLRNGRLWATHTAALPASGTATVTAAQWWEVDPFTSTALQSGQELGSSPDFFAYFPSIAVNANNEVLIGFSGSSTEVSVGSYFVQRDDSMPLGTMGPITAIKEQTGLVMDKTRWGDYSATHVDPVDDTTMWTIQLIAGASNRYTTWWAKFSGSSAPRVLDAAAIDETTVRLTFNKAMTDNAAVIDPAIYQFTGGPPALIAESVTRVDSDTVDISVNSMGIGLSYTLTVSPGPTDLSGTPVDPSANTIVFIAEPAPPIQLPLGNQMQFILLTLLGISGALVAGRTRPSN